MPRLQPGQIRISRHNRIPRFLAIAALIILFAAGAFYFLRKRNPGPLTQTLPAPLAQSSELFPITFCPDNTEAPGTCYPNAPNPPGQFLAITHTAPDHDDAHHAFVAVAEFTRIHAVASASDLPEIVRKTGVRVTSATLTTTAGLASAGNPPLIFEGDADIRVGPLVARDRMLSLLQTNNSGITAMDFLYQPSQPRGPPAAIVVRNIWVVGTVHKFDGPNQSAHSELHAAVIDLDLRPTPQQQSKYETDLAAWHQRMAQMANMPDAPFDRITEVEDARAIIKQHNDDLMRAIRDRAPRQPGGASMLQRDIDDRTHADDHPEDGGR